MQYIFETDYSFSARLTLNRALARIAGSWKGRLARLACIAGAAAILVCAWVLCSAQGFTFVIVLPVLCACAILLLALFLDYVRAWLSGRLVLKRDTRHREEFYADAFVLSNASSSVQLKYSQIWRACETRDYFLLFLDEKHAHILSKKGLVQGELSRFPAFIADKTGTPVRTLHWL